MSAAVVIVGAGLGGARLVADLRNEGYGGELILVGRETHIPYDRPPLSKAVLTGDKDDVDLQPAEFYAEKKVDLRTGTLVTAIDPGAHTITVEPAGGRTPEMISYSTLVLATGLNPRSLPFAEGKAGVHTLRTFDDAMALRSEIDGASSAVVIGAGFIGCEVAASLKTKGLEVTVVEPAPAPLAVAPGEQVGNMVGRIHADGTELPADIVVLGIGSTPALEYLEGSEIVLVEQAAKVAYAILDVDESNARPFVPYFWSDQFDVKVQALGRPSAGDDVHVISDDGTKFVVYYSRDGIFTAVVGAGKAGAVMKMRAKLLAATPISELID